MADKRRYDFHRVENRWRLEWAREGAHRAPSRPDGPKYFAHDAAPFPNGALHMGHVRTYVLGDVAARFRRLTGHSVLYHSGFDSFGLPIELEAIRRGVAPDRLVARSIETMKRQLDRLGISYDWSMVADTSDPDCYRWTQWLFLELFDAGLVQRKRTTLYWCPRCRTTLARLQVDEGGCWRCGTPVKIRRMSQWFVLTSQYRQRLRATLGGLDGWSDRARRMIAALLAVDGDEIVAGRRGRGGGDWLVSRQRSWGTPIPLVHCRDCGTVPVERGDLPVRLPEKLDWARGSGALARCAAFVHASCPRCHGPARRETDTLDCFFDDIWCFLQGIVVQGGDPGFDETRLGRWLPVDRCQSGLDTFYYFHLYRFLGAFLHDRGILVDPEPIAGFLGNEMVLSRGRKMSKHLGNTVSPGKILRRHGADALRVAVLWAAGPQRALHWRDELLDKAVAFLDGCYELFGEYGRPKLPSRAAGRPATPSRAAARLSARVDVSLDTIAGRIAADRPNAAIEELSELVRAIARFAQPRVPSARLTAADAAILDGALADCAIALAPFAPHLAEECWRLCGRDGLVCRAGWPRQEVRRVDPLPGCGANA